MHNPSGNGTYTENGIIYSALCGMVETLNKVVIVNPKLSPYKPEVGDVIIGKVNAVDKKSWRIDINAQREASLQLTSINLPGGEQRRRSEDDVMQMRAFFEENDLLSAEVQQVHKDGGVNLQTRNLKYGKLKNGILIEVNHNLIRKMKFHFVELVSDIKAIIGINGLIWIYYSTIKIESDYFTDDQNLVNLLNKHEILNQYAGVNILLFKNIILSLDKHRIRIDHTMIMKFHELYLEYIGCKADNVEIIQQNIVIPNEVEDIIINKLKQFGKSKHDDLAKEVKNITKMMQEVSDEDME
jgi:exosome complex component RRP4